jgi:hypothetical protein
MATVTFTLGLLLAHGAPASSAPPPVIDPGDGGHYAPTLDPADFVDRVDNVYLPFLPGARWTYEGTSDGQVERTRVVVTADRKMILGIPAVVVRDTVRVGGTVVEDTHDWFAQDREGNVWYLGEDVLERRHGALVRGAGSWEAGVDGAAPGIVMPAAPEPGHAFRQEFSRGVAEDLVEVVAVDARKRVPAGRYDHVIVTKEWNPLEPKVVEEKRYAPGVGLVAERTLRGGHDRSALTAYTPGG